MRGDCLCVEKEIRSTRYESAAMSNLLDKLEFVNISISSYINLTSAFFNLP